MEKDDINNPQIFEANNIKISAKLNSQSINNENCNETEEKSLNYKLPLHIPQIVTNQINCTDNDSCEIISWKSSSKSAYLIHPQTKTIFEQELKLSQNLCGCMICRIPDNKLFFYGNLPISGLAFILDSSDNISYVREGRPTFGAGGVYYNGFVYAFGGCDYHDLWKASVRYSLSENKWSEIMPLPIKSYYCSCEVFNGVILIYGYQHNCLYIYDPAIDNYTAVKVPLSSSTYKIIIKVDSKGYILDNGGTIYESLENNWFQWEKCRKGEINKGGLDFSLRVKYENYIYYMINHELYQFSLKPIDIFLINNIPF